MDISEIKNNLLNNCNHLIKEYLNVVESNVNNSTRLNETILNLTNQNKLKLSELTEFQNELKEYKKKTYDYELIINNLQKELSKNNIDDNSNNGSIIKIQADSIREKDIYIEQLLKKIDFLQNQLLNKNNVKLSISNPKLDNSKNEPEPESEPEPEPEPKPEPDPEPDPEPEPKPEPDPEPDPEPEPEPDPEPDPEPEPEPDPEPESEPEEDNVINTKRIKFKKNPYIIIIGEDPQYIYSITKNNTIGDKIGIQKLTKSGNKTIKFFPQ